MDECGLVKQQPSSTRCQYVKEHCDSGWMSGTQAYGSARLCIADRRACHADSLINYLQLYFCHAQPAGTVAAGLLLILCVFLLLLLFRVLGSTAENFFSPILTQLSQELGLPPRLAGGMLVLGLILCYKCPSNSDCERVIINAVTFLALGNGAPDISSSIAAVRAGQYKLALGSLLGTGRVLTGTHGFSNAKFTMSYACRFASIIIRLP